jgi:hypothetical protein
VGRALGVLENVREVSHMYREGFRVCFGLYNWPTNQEMSGAKGSGMLDQTVGI